MRKFIAATGLSLLVLITSGLNQPAEATTCSAGASLLINGGFEQPVIGMYGTPLGSIVDGWETLDTVNEIEIWGTGVDHSGSPGQDGPYAAAEGNQFIEVVANSLEPVFQDFATDPGSTLTISLKQQARYQNGNSAVLIQMGPVGGPYANVGIPTAIAASWSSNNYTYVVPNGQTMTRLLINADTAADTINSPQQVGSPLVDDVSVTVTTCAPAVVSTPTPDSTISSKSQSSLELAQTGTLGFLILPIAFGLFLSGGSILYIRARQKSS